MRRVHLWRIALVLSLLLAATPSWAQAVRKAVEENRQALVAAFARGDAAAISALYTDHATVMPAGGPIGHGRAVAQEFWKGLLDAGVKNLTAQTLSVEPLGRAAREVGKFTMDLPNPQKQFTRVEGKYLVIWRKVGSKWFLEVDMWNTDH
jgi:ketosteroid isomerase-like protein